MLETVFSGNLWSCLKEVKPFDVLHGECVMTMVPMQGIRASSRVDLGYTELFLVVAVTSVSLQTCDSVLEDYLEFHQGSQGYYLV